MKKTYAILAMLIIGLLAIGISGCSSTTSSDPLTLGDNNDVNFQFVEQEVFSEEIYAGIDISMELSESFIDSIPGVLPTRRHFVAGAAADVVLSSLSYSWANGYHIFEFTGYVSEFGSTDTVDFSGIDSIQVFDNGQVQQVPDDNSDAFSFNAHFTALNRNGTDSLTGDHAVQIAFDAVDPDLIIFDAQLDEAIAFSYTDSAQTSTCQVNVASSFTAVDVAMPTGTETDCPLDGTITVTVSLSMNCGGTGENPFALSIDGSWTAVGTFDGTNETFTITDGTNQWTSTEPCGVQPASGIAGLFTAQ